MSNSSIFNSNVKAQTIKKKKKKKKKKEKVNELRYPSPDKVRSNQTEKMN